MNKEIYIASCEKDGGIYRYILKENGSLEKVDYTPMNMPMYMAKHNDKMYVILKGDFEQCEESGFVVYDIKNSRLENPTEVISTKGLVACHLSVDDDGVYVANYVSGSVIKMPDKLVEHSGKGVSMPRQETPHAHFAGFTPDNKYVLVADLGLDTIFVYNKDLELVNSFKVLQGHGARHIVFSDDGKYLFVVNELASTVSCFKYSDAKTEYLNTISCVEEWAEGKWASAIRYSNGKVYVANRGDNTIAVFKHSEDSLKIEGIYPCGGDWPRDMDIFGDFIIVCNERENNVTVIDKATFEIVHTENLKTPLCVIS